VTDAIVLGDDNLASLGLLVVAVLGKDLERDLRWGSGGILSAEGMRTIPLTKRPARWASDARWWLMAASSSIRVRVMLKSLATFSLVQLRNRVSAFCGRRRLRAYPIGWMQSRATGCAMISSLKPGEPRSGLCAWR
jgi:hypothetical protein